MGEKTDTKTALTYYRLAYLFGIPAIPIFLNVVLNLTIGSYKDVLASSKYRIKDIWKLITKIIWYPIWIFTIIVVLANFSDLLIGTRFFFIAPTEPIKDSFIPLIGEISPDYMILGINVFWKIWSFTFFITIAMEIAYMIRSIGFDKDEPAVYDNKIESIKEFFKLFRKGLKDKNPNVKWIKTFSSTTFIALISIIIQGLVGYNWKFSFPISSYTNFLVFFTVAIVLIGEVIEAREGAITAFTEAFNTNINIRMLRTVSHEMNQSLITLGGFFNRLEENYQEKLRNNSFALTKDKILILIDELQVQKESLKRLNRTQSDLSSHAKMFTTEIKPVLLNKIIDEETEEEKYSKRGKNFNFTKSLDPAIKEVEIDEMQMRTILRNLIENAIDALSEKKKGTIDIKSEQSGDQVIIEITDNGMGIPKNWYDKVKEPFCAFFTYMH